MGDARVVEGPKTDHEASDDVKEATHLATIHDVYSFGEGKFWLVLGGLLCSVVTGCVMPAMGFVYANSFQELGGSTSQADFLEGIRRVAYNLMVLGVIAFTFMTAQATLLESAAGIMTRDMKNKWFQALLRQDMAFYDIKDVSGTASIISSNGQVFKKGTGRKVGEMSQFAITMIGGLAYAFYSSWQAALITLAVVPFMSLSALFVMKINTSQTSRAAETYGEAGGIAYDTVSSIRTILSLNAVPMMVSKFTNATQKAFEGAAGLAYLMGLANGSMMGSFLLSYMALTLYGAFLLYTAVRATGCDPSGTVPGATYCDPRGQDIFGALMGVTIAGAVLPQVSVSIEALAGARAACYPAIIAMKRRIGYDDDPERSPDDVDAHRRGEHIALPVYKIDSSSEDGLRPDSVVGEIIFDNVTFAYPTRSERNVFNNFSLRIKPGTTVALVGQSGCGKSTVVQLLERFYDPTHGSILLDGNDLTNLNVKWLRSQIGLVGQEPLLFARSIKENIRYGKLDATQEEIENAARSASCHDFISAFPDGYDTQVGDKGAQLSGGQKQRIAIARILIKEPKILLLDEATSALDSESEAVVQDALDNLLQGGERTIIVIAHRLSTVKNADMICVVHEGRIAEAGTHDELMTKHGHYFDLVQAQTRTKQDDVGAVSNACSISSSFHDTEETVQASATEGQSKVLLQFKDVHFRYPSRPNKIFQGLNLAIYEGETLALVGPSGHGKSTIIQLIERFYDPDSGVIELHGIDLKDINVAYLRNKVGLVSQEPTLFDTTIGENIRYGNPDATQEEVEAAAKRANIHETIMKFPEKYETSVGSGGIQVSGGQKQRIAIARSIVKKPDILLLDEATSALDTASEKIVQAALDEIMSSEGQTTVVVAHRLSTILKADRIAVIVDGMVREIGTHDELMRKVHGHYRRLQILQDMNTDQVTKNQLRETVKSHDSSTVHDISQGRSTNHEKALEDIDNQAAKANAKRAWAMASEDRGYFVIGAIGAFIAGLVFPGWGFIFAYMIDLLYTPIFVCENGTIQSPPGVSFSYSTCQEYWDASADSMRSKSFMISYGYLGTIAATMFGTMLLFYGFNIASERMNKRVRDTAFKALTRQEVGYFDMHPTGVLTSRLADDAALLHSFSGEPIRTLVMNTASVLVGLIVAFVFMWPFASITLLIIPFMGFGALMEMKTYMGEIAAENDEDVNSPGSIVVETLLNIRTVASLNLETTRVIEFDKALVAEDPMPIRSNIVKGSASGLGQFVQMWGLALMFWWGGYLLFHYPESFDYRDFLISMFSLLFSISGMGVAAQGATNRDKAKLAAERIFELTDRKSLIDPLGEGGKKDF